MLEHAWLRRAGHGYNPHHHHPGESDTPQPFARTELLEELYAPAFAREQQRFDESED